MFLVSSLAGMESLFKSRNSCSHGLMGISKGHTDVLMDLSKDTLMFWCANGYIQGYIVQQDTTQSIDHI